MKRTLSSFFGLIFLAGMAAVWLASQTAAAHAQTIKNVNVNSLLQKAVVSFSPQNGSFTEGSTFEVPIVIDTKGQAINAVELYINFDPKKLQIIEPTGGQSIIGLWVEPPSYSNTAGTLKLVGAIGGGITTKAGIIAKVTFKALASGDTKITFSGKSQVLANDGFGTVVQASFGTAYYSLQAAPPEGPKVFSETHQFSDKWYNNNSPVLAWDKEDGVTDYSFVIDDKPFTIPDNGPDTAENRISLSAIADGINYFHIKARKGAVWGGTTHFLLRIDTLPPAAFTPTFEKVSEGLGNRAFVSFETTDSLSGLDHYEIGVIDKNEPANVSPVFVNATSPFQVPLKTSGDIRVVVRAIDNAGNVRDMSVDIAGFSWIVFFKQNYMYAVSGLLLLITLWALISYYRFTRRVAKALKVAMTQQQQQLSAPQNLPPPQYTYPPQEFTRQPMKEIPFDGEQKKKLSDYFNDNPHLGEKGW